MGVPFGWKFQIVPGVAHEGRKMVDAAAPLIQAHISAFSLQAATHMNEKSKGKRK